MRFGFPLVSVSEHEDYPDILVVSVRPLSLAGLMIASVVVPEGVGLLDCDLIDGTWFSIWG